MKHILAAFICLSLCSFTASSQFLVSAEIIETYTAAQLNLVPGLNAEFDIEMYKVIYNTVDAVGDATIASGAFARPLSDNCTDFPMVMYHHGTTLNKENVPSRINGEAQISNFMGGSGYYSMAPDYVGMGDSPGLHPYQHALSEATAGVDMIRAVRELLVDLGDSDNGEIFITGYSQGGHAAMAMHKYIEENDLLTEFNVVASAPLSGAYDMSGSQASTITSGEPYSNPGYIVYVMASYDLAYGDIYDTYSDILQSPYDEIVVPFFNGNNTTLSMGQLNPQLPMVITDLMTPTEYASFENDLDNPLRIALAANDVYDWTPQRTVRLYYCTEDEQVNFNNSVVAVETMQANGAPDVTGFPLGPLNHSDCTFPALLGALNYFNSVRTDCYVSGIDELARIDIGLYPNPAAERVRVTSGTPITAWELYDSKGLLVESSRTKKSQSPALNFELDMRSLSPGLYQLHVEDVDGLIGVNSIILE
jgi:pimeloyl-ACP methyl ester carboxylesterase